MQNLTLFEPYFRSLFRISDGNVQVLLGRGLDLVPDGHQQVADLLRLPVERRVLGSELVQQFGDPADLRKEIVTLVNLKLA